MKFKKLGGMLTLAAVALFTFNSNAEVFTVTNPDEFQQALNEAAQNGEDDVINVLAGDYDLSETLFYIPNETENYSLTIQGEDLSTTKLNANREFRILYLNLRNIDNDENVKIEIKNISFENGFHLGNGGAIDIEGELAQLNIENCNFSNNYAPYGGAVFILTEGDINVSGTSFVNNSGKVGGALLYLVDKGFINLKGNIFKENKVTYDGGAIALYLSNGKVILSSNKIEENLSGKYGGGIFASVGDSLFVINNNVFFKNTALNYRKETGQGGALYINSSKGNIYVVNNTIVKNSAYNKGGGIYSSLYYEEASALIYNNIIRDNRLNTEAPYGEDIYINNDYTQDGVVLASKVSLFNNNLGKNANVDNPNSEDLYIKEASTYQQGNNIFDNPMFVDIDNGDFHIKSSSPCINTGNNDILTTLSDMDIDVDTDIDGDNRIFDNVVDIGADEYLAPDIEVAPEMLDFGEFMLGDEPVTKTFTIMNVGRGILKFKSIWLWGVERKAYKITDNQCINAELAYEDTCNISVTIYPDSVGLKKAFVVIVSNDPDERKVIYWLNGLVTADKVPAIEAEPTLVNFGDITIKNKSVPEIIQIINNGEADLVVHKLKIFGINASEFRISSENCTKEAISPGSSCEVSVVFAPDTEGSKKGVLFIYSNDPDNFATKIPLRGNGN